MYKCNHALSACEVLFFVNSLTHPAKATLKFLSLIEAGINFARNLWLFRILEISDKLQ